MGAQRASQKRSEKAGSIVVYAIKDGATLDRPLRVAVVGGGPGGASAADMLAKNGIETYMFERKMDNCKVDPRSTRDLARIACCKPSQSFA